MKKGNGLILRGKTWHIDVVIKGHRIRQSTGLENMEDAIDVLAKIRIDIIKGQYFPKPQGENKLFCEMMSKFVKEHRHYKGRMLSKNTLESYSNSLKHLLPVFADMPLSKVTESTIERYILKRQEEKAAPATINRELALLSVALNTAKRKWKWIEKNPWEGIGMLPENNRRVRFLTQEEVENLYKALPEWLKPIVTVARFTGLRIFNLLGLEWNMVDFFRKTITVGKTKNGDPLGLPMTNVVFETLKEVSKVRHINTTLIFPDSRGQNRSRVVVGEAFKRACQKTGIMDFHFHDLRHDFASNLVSKGVDIYSVKELLGHKDMKMTVRYAHLSPEKLRRDICVLDDPMTQNPHNQKKGVNSY
ncbi:MAG: tyrosine-type recombinase/integrase [Nitrospinae bacterium]|nr:tyrosine-type recombinase/integrase [Nitrospinota bacterium]